MLLHLYDVERLADDRASGSNLKDGTNTPQSDKQRPKPSSKSTIAGKYLPGSKEYECMLGSAASKNSRNDTPMSVWLPEWDRKWERITDEGKEDGQYHIHQHLSF